MLLIEFRRVLSLIRRELVNNRSRLFLIAGVATLVLGGVTVGLDFILPWGGWGMIVRTVLLLPTAVAIFVLGYGLSLLYYFFKKRNDDWLSLREKFSPTWRMRISMMIGAVLIVLVYAITMKPGYTFVSSIVAAIVIGLFVFMRKSTVELNREDLGIPDARDAALNTHLRRYTAVSRDKVETKAQAKKDEKTKARVQKARAKLAEAEAELEKPESL